MESSSSDVQMSHCAEDLNSESTIEIKIKTLDSQTYNLRVNKRVPVPLLKEKIATVTGILSEQQRLICRGRVLKDDELLSAYHVEDGHTLHLVVRQPGQSATSGNAGNEGTTSNPARRRGPTMTRSIVLEAINVGQGSELSVAQLLQSLLRAPSSTQVSSGPAPSDARPSEGAQSSTQNGVRAVLDQMLVPPLFQSETSVGLSEPNVIPDSLTTISQYINFLRDSFRREGFLENGLTLTFIWVAHILNQSENLVIYFQYSLQDKLWIMLTMELQEVPMEVVLKIMKASLIQLRRMGFLLQHCLLKLCTLLDNFLLSMLEHCYLSVPFFYFFSLWIS
jgi:uncharacterized ubiquitin-like protein YukD